MVLVKVLRISSISDPETGKLGKQIELVEARRRGGGSLITGIGGIGGEDEARLIKNIVGQLQSIGLFPQMRELTLPKLTLFLTESEYDMLGIRFEINDIFEVTMKDEAITLKKAVEEGLTA